LNINYEILEVIVVVVVIENANVYKDTLLVLKMYSIRNVNYRFSILTYRNAKEVYESHKIKYIKYRVRRQGDNVSCMYFILHRNPLLLERRLTVTQQRLFIDTATTFVRRT